jgi:hypothetical protein
MTTMSKKLTVALGIVLVGTILTAKASAECGNFKLIKPKATSLTAIGSANQRLDRRDVEVQLYRRGQSGRAA